MSLMRESLTHKNLNSIKRIGYFTNTLAICIPTYKNPSFIKEIIQKEYEFYKKNDIKLIIADSSDDDDTRRLIDSVNEGGGEIIYYHFPPDIHSNEKVYCIYQMVGKEIKCDYLWIRSDALRAHRYLLESIQYYLSFEYDLIVTTYRGDWERGIREVANLQYLFEKYGWTLCLYGGAIVNARTMLMCADWQYLKEKYLVENKRNFSHVCMYFENLLRIKKCEKRNPSVLTMDLPGYAYSGTPGKIRSAWHNDIFKIWLEYWPAAIESLPEFYKNKIEVIRSFGRNEIYYTNNYLLQLSEQGILSQEVLEKYEKRIRKYSGVPYERFSTVLNGIEGNGTMDIRSSEDEYQELGEFCRLYSRLFIYGCGKKARRYLNYLKDKDISIEGFVVSDEEKENNTSQFEGYAVKGLSDFTYDEKTGIILGLGMRNQLSVLPALEKMDWLSSVFAFPLIKLRDLDALIELKKHRIAVPSINRWGNDVL